MSVFEDILQDIKEIDSNFLDITLLIRPEIYEIVENRIKEEIEMSDISINTDIVFNRNVIVTSYIDKPWVVLPYNKDYIMGFRSIYGKRNITLENI